MSNTRMIENFKVQFPYVYNDMEHCYAIGDWEMVVQLSDGRAILYDDLDKTIRNLPRDRYRMSEDESRSEFGFRLSKLMYRKGITQMELAERAGLTQAQLSKYITGKTTPSFYTVDKIAKALDCSIDTFRYV